jgi:hypothetical protein
MMDTDSLCCPCVHVLPPPPPPKTHTFTWGQSQLCIYMCIQEHCAQLDCAAFDAHLTQLVQCDVQLDHLSIHACTCMHMSHLHALLLP